MLTGFVVGGFVMWTGTTIVGRDTLPHAYHDVVRDYAAFDQPGILNYQATFVKNESCYLRDFVAVGSRVGSGYQFLQVTDRENIPPMYDRPAGSNTLYISIAVPAIVDRVELRTIHECNIIVDGAPPRVESVRVDSTFDSIDVLTDVSQNNMSIITSTQ